MLEIEQKFYEIIGEMVNWFLILIYILIMEGDKQNEDQQIPEINYSLL